MEEKNYESKFSVKDDFAFIHFTYRTSANQETNRHGNIILPKEYYRVPIKKAEELITRILEKFKKTEVVDVVICSYQKTFHYIYEEFWQDQQEILEFMEKEIKDGKL